MTNLKNFICHHDWTVGNMVYFSDPINNKSTHKLLKTSCGYLLLGTIVPLLLNKARNYKPDGYTSHKWSLLYKYFNDMLMCMASIHKFLD